MSKKFQNTPPTFALGQKQAHFERIESFHPNFLNTFSSESTSKEWAKQIAAQFKLSIMLINNLLNYEIIIPGFIKFD